MEIIIRADDLGYSKAVSVGIAETVKNGIVKNVGLMVNMRDSIHGALLLKNEDVCLGLHTCISSGVPVSDWEKVDSLVDENHKFKSSKMYREMKEDICYQQAVVECEAQYQKFIDITGRKPAYMDGHAIMSNNFFKAIEETARKHDVTFVGMPENLDMKNPIQIHGKDIFFSPSQIEGMNAFECFKMACESNKLNLIIYHPGYIDADLLNSSSLTLPRVFECQHLCSEKTKQYVIKNNVKCIRFDEL